MDEFRSMAEQRRHEWLLEQRQIAERQARARRLRDDADRLLAMHEEGDIECQRRRRAYLSFEGYRPTYKDSEVAKAKAKAEYDYIGPGWKPHMERQKELLGLARSCYKAARILEEEQ